MNSAKRTPFDFLLAVFLGLIAGSFFEPALGAWSILVGIAVAMIADWLLRRRRARRNH